MNTAFPNTPNTHSLAAVLLLSVAALVACQSPPPVVVAPAVEAAVPAAAMPAPQAPFDTTPITPVESAGASAS